ncbi:MAG: SRPBCC family protein [Chloroflexi bacterium]|nr:SRPBCC family protein [Chloroflexota bacterium]
MLRLQAAQTIDRPPDQVFRYVATDHFANHPTWDPTIVELVQTSAGPMGAGTTARLVRLDRGKQVEGTVEVVEYEPDRRFAAISRFGRFVLQQRVTFEPVGEGSTRLTLAIDAEAAGLMRFILPLFKWVFRQTMGESLRWIKDGVERGASREGGG